MLRLLMSIGGIQILFMLVGVVRAKALSVLLGPSGFGVVSTVDQTVMSVVQLGGLSLPLAAMKYMARSHSESEKAFQESFAAFLSAMVVLSILATLVASALFVLRPGVFGEDLASLRD